MPFRDFFRGVLNRVSQPRGAGAGAYCPVITCQTMRCLAHPDIRRVATGWLRTAVLPSVGPGKLFDLAAASRADQVLMQLNDFLVDRMEQLERDAGADFLWLYDTKADSGKGKGKGKGKGAVEGTPYLPSSTGSTPQAIASWCWMRTSTGRPEMQCPECTFCGGLAKKCQSILTAAYKHAWGASLPVGGSIDMPRIDCFSEEQRAAYSIAVALATLRVVAAEVCEGAVGDAFGRLLEDWLPLLARSWLLWADLPSSLDKS